MITPLKHTRGAHDGGDDDDDDDDNDTHGTQCE